MMEVSIAGYNIDKALIDKHLNAINATPESISAAYARISRSSKSIKELRQEAQEEILKARASNQNIIFDMGHSSIAEHAVFNIDLVGISRYLAEVVQRSRLASFTEKSQRYVSFSKDYVVPAELSQSLRDEYISLMDALFAEYETSMNYLLEGLAESDLSKRDRESRAKEDARYILPLCTKTQMGITINARSLEGLLRRLSALDLDEAKELYNKIYSLVSEISPSVIKYTEADDFSKRKLCYEGPLAGHSNNVRIVSTPLDPDHTVLAAILYESADQDFSAIIEQLKAMPHQEWEAYWQNLFRDIKPWSKLPRAFEMIDFCFEMTMSECAWSQFKRHRLCTILAQRPAQLSQQIIPPSITCPSHILRWQSLFTDVDALRSNVSSTHPHISVYCRTNAHTINILAKMNLRELYHFCRLRSDEHAQWEIRTLSQTLQDQIKSLAPFAAQLLMGKSEFPHKQRD